MRGEAKRHGDGMRHERHDALSLRHTKIDREAPVKHERDAIFALKLGLHQRDFPAVHYYLVVRERTWERHAERLARELLMRFHRASFRIGT
jgi:hypothetical protein